VTEVERAKAAQQQLASILAERSSSVSQLTLEHRAAAGEAQALHAQCQALRAEQAQAAAEASELQQRVQLREEELAEARAAHAELRQRCALGDGADGGAEPGRPACGPLRVAAARAAGAVLRAGGA
jgi:hypothetical protein